MRRVAAWRRKLGTEMAWGLPRGEECGQRSDNQIEVGDEREGGAGGRRVLRQLGEGVEREAQPGCGRNNSRQVGDLDSSCVTLRKAIRFPGLQAPLCLPDSRWSLHFVSLRIFSLNPPRASCGRQI